MNAHREVLRGAAWNLIGYFIAGVAAFSMPFILIKSIGRGNYGVYTYLTLLITQAYLLLGGLGEALASQLTQSRNLLAARQRIQEALGAALSLGLLSFALWLWKGPLLLQKLLSLDSPWQEILLRLKVLAGLSLIGYKVAILLGWVPLALGHKRALVLLPVGQVITQALLPMAVVIWCKANLPLLMQVTLWGYICLGLYMWIGVSYLLGYPLWPRFSILAWQALWRGGLWQNLSQWSGLFLNFFERTLIGRSASLNYMGLYSAGHYFCSKGFQILHKAAESLLPQYGGESSPLRRQLRLSQSIWLLMYLTTPILLLGYGLGLVLLPALVQPWGTLEVRLWAGLVASSHILCISVPLVPFLIGTGRFRLFYLYSTVMLVIQATCTLLWVPRGYYYWAPIPALSAGIGFLSFTWYRSQSQWQLWRSWVGETFLRALSIWTLILGLLVGEGKLFSSLSLGASLVGVGMFLITEKHSPMWRRKRLFLQTLSQTVQSLLGTHVPWFRQRLRP